MNPSIRKNLYEEGIPSPIVKYNIKLTIAYDGTSYLGWQRTRMGKSIEEELGKVLETIYQHPIKLQAASRTDEGVHAKGQIANFFSSKYQNLERLRCSLNQLLPPAISILKAEDVDLFFHPTLNAIGKEYRYYFNTGPVQLPHERLYSWHVYQALDFTKMSEASKMLTGKHDFTSFCNQGSNCSLSNFVREVYSIDICLLTEKCYYISINGNKFLYKMARNLVGSIIDVGRGKISLDSLKGIINGRQRVLAGVTAPARGLFLHKVFY